MKYTIKYRTIPLSYSLDGYMNADEHELPRLLMISRTDPNEVKFSQLMRERGFDHHVISMITVDNIVHYQKKVEYVHITEGHMSDVIKTLPIEKEWVLA